MSDNGRRLQGTEMNNLLKNSYEWKGVYRNLVQEKLTLQKELELISKQYNTALSNEKELLREITQLKTFTANNLEDTIKHLANLEETNKKIGKEIKQLESNVPSISNVIVNVQEKESQLDILKLIMAEKDEKYQKELKEIRQKCEERVQKEMEKCAKEMEEMDVKIKEMHEEIEKIKSEKDDELFQTKQECKEEMIKLKEEQIKEIKCLTTTSSCTRMEIFRQKLLHLQSEHSSEVTALQMTIASLRLQMQLCPNCSASAVYIHEFNDTLAHKKQKTAFT